MASGGGSFSLTSKRRRVINTETAKVKLAAVKEIFGREINVFETSVPSSNAVLSNGKGEESDDFYKFTAQDYYRVWAAKKEDKFLKTRKIREAEEAARRSRRTKAVIRVRFPDNHTLEATFHPSETFQSLMDLLAQVIAQPEQPFYIYTTPPKKVMNYMSQDFYSAGFCPGAIVYFSYNDNTVAGPYLQAEILSLKHLHDVANDQDQQSVEEERKAISAEKNLVRPKWLKMLQQKELQLALSQFKD